MNLSQKELGAIAEMQSIYDRLSDEGRAEAASILSWAERNFLPAMIGVLVIGIMIGALL